MATCLRPYQKRVVERVATSNAIVKMPTGSGKTIVAAELVKRNRMANANEMTGRHRTKAATALFLVPTCELVEQQAKVVETWTGLCTARFFGGCSDPSLDSLDVLVSTPAAFLALKARKPQAFVWSSFSLCIFDEVHHVLKDHPYRHIALSLKAEREEAGAPSSAPLSRGVRNVQVVGLTASLTYQVDDAAIKSTLEKLCYELAIDRMESPSLQELREGGYVPRFGDEVELDVCRQIPEGIIPKEARSPHQIYQSFINRVESGSLTEFSSKIWTVVKELESYATEIHPSFQSPLRKQKLSTWENYAHSVRMSLREHQIQHFFQQLEVWYVALRVLVQTWEEEEQIVLQWLTMQDAFNLPMASTIVDGLSSMADNGHNLFKLNKLKFHLTQKRQQYGRGLKALVFVQQRLASVVISHFINNDADLGSMALRAGSVTSRGASVTPSINVTKDMVARTITEFRSGDINVLVATSVVEEGFDVPAANVVIMYDAMKDSVELCQRSGRARALQSSIVVLDERSDRTVQRLESVRQLQDDIVRTFEPKKIQVNEESERRKQQDRERHAYQRVLTNRDRCPKQASAALNEYVKKTKAHLSEEFQLGGKQGEFICKLSYQSILRKVSDRGAGSSKKKAKALACCKLLVRLNEEASYP